MGTQSAITGRSLPTGLLLDSYFCEHETVVGHPECPERITAIEQRLFSDGIAGRCKAIARSGAGRHWIEANHTAKYIERLETACRGGQPYIDSQDSSICPDSFDVALSAVGSVLNAIDEVQAGVCRNAFCAVRPPGHHAEREFSMGFCLFNNIAIAARYLLEKYQLSRVLIIDWDVHHGNGTQNAFYDSEAVFFCSLHQHPLTLYPGTGFEKERGTGNGEGFTLNIPMRPGSGDAEYRKAFESQVLPAAEKFAPEFVLISAGFDAHREDSISAIELDDDSYRWMTEAVCGVASNYCGGKVVSMLEGGYALSALGRSVSEHLRVLLER